MTPDELEALLAEDGGSLSGCCDGDCTAGCKRAEKRRVALQNLAPVLLAAWRVVGAAEKFKDSAHPHFHRDVTRCRSCTETMECLIAALDAYRAAVAKPEEKTDA